MKQPRNRNPLASVISMKFDRRLWGRLLSIKSNRNDLYWADIMTRVRFPVPAKNSSHSTSWPGPAPRYVDVWRKPNVCAETYNCRSIQIHISLFLKLTQGFCKWTTTKPIQASSVFAGLLNGKSPIEHEDNHDILLGVGMIEKTFAWSKLQMLHWINPIPLYHISNILIGHADFYMHTTPCYGKNIFDLYWLLGDPETKQSEQQSIKVQHGRLLDAGFCEVILKDIHAKVLHI